MEIASVMNFENDTDSNFNTECHTNVQNHTRITQFQAEHQIRTAQNHFVIHNVNMKIICRNIEIGILLLQSAQLSHSCFPRNPWRLMRQLSQKI